MQQLDQSDLDHCLDVTRRGRSNLWFVGRGLPARRRAMFASAYASMRIVDDFVDEAFLTLADDRRDADRAAAHAVVDNWLATIEAALSGKAPEKPVPGGSIDPRIARAVGACFDGADIGPEPWRLLARSMHRDIQERPFAIWEDFLEYCEGATVAPASIFLYVVAADLAGAPKARHRLPADPADCVRDMAVFCYLVHIARDIVKDAAAGPSLLTIPEDLLGSHGLTRSELAVNAVGEGDTRVLDLIADLAVKADEYRRRGEDWRDRLLPLMGMREKTAFAALMTVYGALHDRLRSDPAFALAQDPEQREQLRRTALAAANIEI